MLIACRRRLLSACRRLWPIRSQIAWRTTYCCRCCRNTLWRRRRPSSGPVHPRPDSSLCSLVGRRCHHKLQSTKKILKKMGLLQGQDQPTYRWKQSCQECTNLPYMNCTPCTCKSRPLLKNKINTSQEKKQVPPVDWAGAEMARMPLTALTE